MKRIAVLVALVAPLLFASMAEASTTITYADATNDVRYCLMTGSNYHDCVANSSVPGQDLESIALSQAKSKVTIETKMVDGAAYDSVVGDRWADIELVDTNSPTKATLSVIFEIFHKQKSCDAIWETTPTSFANCTVSVTNDGVKISISGSDFSSKWMNVTSADLETRTWVTDGKGVNSWRDYYQYK